MNQVDDVYRRLSRSLKERADFVKSEIEVFLAKESLHLTSLKENLQHEIGNFDSNSDFAGSYLISFHFRCYLDKVIEQDLMN